MPVCAGQHAGLCKWVDTGLMWFNTLVHEALAKFPLNTVSTKQYHVLSMYIGIFGYGFGLLGEQDQAWHLLPKTMK